MRVLLVVNPSATRVTPEREAVVTGLLGARHELEVARTTGRDHATVLARAAVQDGVDHVVVLAGDGTLNEVVSALAGTSTVLSTLPGGSTNIYARTVGLPDDLAAATARVESALHANRSRQVGLGSANGRSFLLHAGIGWDAELVSIVERHAHLKPRIGHALFAAAGLRAFFGTYDRRRPHFSVVAHRGEGPPVEVPEGYFAVVLNSDPYTYVHTRPFVVAPSTTLDSPLSVVVCTSLRVRDFLAVMSQALRGDEGVRDGHAVRVLTGVHELTIRRLPGDPAPSMPHQVDGDHLGDVDELHFRHLPAALRVLEV